MERIPTHDGRLSPPSPSQAGALPLPLVKANGFTIVSDAGALGGDGDLHLLSLLGRKPAVEAVAATLLTGKAALLYPEALRSGLEARAPLTWSFRQLGRTLQTGDAHLLLLPARCDVARVQEPSFTILQPLDPAGTETTIAGIVAARRYPLVAWYSLLTRIYTLIGNT